MKTGAHERFMRSVTHTYDCVLGVEDPPCGSTGTGALLNVTDGLEFRRRGCGWRRGHPLNSQVPTVRHVVVFGCRV